MSIQIPESEINGSFCTELEHDTKGYQIVDSEQVDTEIKAS